MKKKLSGLIGIALVALALGSLITSFEVKANTDIEYTMATDSDFSGTSNGSFKYIGSDEYVEIPHKINGVNVTSYYNMFIGSSVKGVKSTNKNVTNMSYMFYDNKATNLDLSNLDTSNVTNMSNMFYNSKSTSLDVSNFDTSKVTNMYEMFADSQITSLDLSSFDTSNVTNMNRMFYYSQATELDVSSFDTSNVIDMDWMFYKNQATELDLSSFDTSGITRMYNMFEGSQATKLDLSNFDTSNVTNMISMFRDSQATKLDLSSFDTSSVTRMDGMFYNSQATTLDLSSFDTSSVTSMSHMFWNSQATKLDLSSFDISNVTSTSSMFRDANATIGYTKTEQDADILNATTNKPKGLLFVVKPIIQSNEVDVTILPGEFSLTTPEISNGFGSVELKADVQTLNASFGAPFTIKDLRGTHEGWRLDVQADQLTNGEHKLPASSLTIKPVAKIERVSNGYGDLPTSSQTEPRPIDDGSTVELVSAPEGVGMGEYDITLPVDALEVAIDATTALTNDGGVYTTTLNWTLVQAP